MLKIFAGMFFAVPSMAFAQATVWTLLDTVTGWVFTLLEIGSVLAIVVFFYGIAVFILNSDDEKKRETSKPIMTWGVIALFVMITLWGIIGFIQLTLGNYNGPGTVDIVIPNLPG